MQGGLRTATRDRGRVAPEQARRVAILKVLVGFGVAVLIPSPFGGWPPISLLLWGLFGDPQSGMETLEFIGGGGILLAFYTAVVFLVWTLATRWVLAILRIGRTRGARE